MPRPLCVKDDELCWRKLQRGLSLHMDSKCRYWLKDGDTVAYRVSTDAVDRLLIAGRIRLDLGDEDQRGSGWRFTILQPAE